jgi:hypothetical protein
MSLAVVRTSRTHCFPVAALRPAYGFPGLARGDYNRPVSLLLNIFGHPENFFIFLPVLVSLAWAQPRLQRVLIEHTNGAPLVDVLLGELKRFTGEEWEQEDDVTLITLQRTSETLSLRV